MWPGATVCSSSGGTFAGQSYRSRRRSCSRVHLRRCSAMGGPPIDPRSGVEGGSCHAARGGQRPRGRAVRRRGAARRLRVWNLRGGRGDRRQAVGSADPGRSTRRGEALLLPGDQARGIRGGAGARPRTGAEQNLAHKAGVVAVDYNYLREPFLIPNDPRLANQWGLTSTRFGGAWNDERRRSIAWLDRDAGARRRSRPHIQRGDQTPTDAANRPMHGGRSCPCARRRVSRLPPRSAQARRRVRGTPTIPRLDVTTQPRNCTIKRRSKSSLRAPSFDSPVGCAITASHDPG